MKTVGDTTFYSREDLDAHATWMVKQHAKCNYRRPSNIQWELIVTTGQNTILSASYVGNGIKGNPNCGIYRIQDII